MAFSVLVNIVSATLFIFGFSAANCIRRRERKQQPKPETRVVSQEKSRSPSEARSSSQGSRVIFSVGGDVEDIVCNGSAVRVDESREDTPLTKLTKKQRRKEMERRRKSLEGDGYTKAQRRKLLKRMSKVASTGKLQEAPTKSDKRYHTTYHAGMDHSSLMTSPVEMGSLSSTEELSDSTVDRQQPHRKGGAGEEDLRRPRERQQPWQISGSRFSVSRAAVPSFCLLGGGGGIGNHLAASSPIATRNMYGVLDSSLHEDPTPVKEKALGYAARRGGAGANYAGGGWRGAAEVGEAPIVESDGELVRRRTPTEAHSSSTRRRIKFTDGGGGERTGGKGGPSGGGGGQNKRSKSSSPKRIGEAARQKEAMKRFNPDKADWIKKK